MGLFPGSQFYSIGPYAHLMPVLPCLNYSSFVEDFENGQYMSLPLFISQEWFGYSGLKLLIPLPSIL